jgi:hypothetical protein
MKTLLLLLLTSIIALAQPCWNPDTKPYGEWQEFDWAPTAPSYNSVDAELNKMFTIIVYHNPDGTNVFQCQYIKDSHEQDSTTN